MVHALEDIHRLLKPNGRLIDLHPFAQPYLIEIHQGGRIAFAEPIRESDDEDEDVRQAEDALALVVQQGLFAIERSSEFDFLTYGSSVAELRDFWAKANAYDNRSIDEAVAAREEEQFARVEEVMGAAGEGAEVAFHEKGRITRLRPVRW